MIRLSFNPAAIPRTTTRERWREIHRWHRIAEKQIRDALEREIEVLRNVLAEERGLPADLRVHLLDELINPPIMVYP